MGLLDGILGGGRRRAAVKSAIAAAEGAGGIDAAFTALAPLRALDRAQALCGLADHFRREDALDPARTALAHAVELDPKCRAAIERLAIVEAERGDLEAALVASAQLVELVPNGLEPVYNHAGLLLAAGRPSEAMVPATGSSRPRHWTVDASLRSWGWVRCWTTSDTGWDGPPKGCRTSQNRRGWA
ncbi:MAG: hypothetical protein WCC48_19385 [Anaeromyxobacteraceae bacterium]